MPGSLSRVRVQPLELQSFSRKLVVRSEAWHGTRDALISGAGLLRATEWKLSRAPRAGRFIGGQIPAGVRRSDSASGRDPWDELPPLSAVRWRGFVALRRVLRPVGLSVQRPTPANAWSI